ncbi:MAG: MTH938/NDUFAF3 family protein, partial [Candidatus Tectimicrobiota bacterium]
MTAIEDYQFGSMTIDGTRYTADLLVLPSGEVLPEWWRAEGHRLVLEDLTAIVGHGARPETLVIGTGAGLSAYGITPLVAPTP